MKKYIMPAVSVLRLAQSEVLCASGEVVIDPEKEVEGGFSRGGWEASDWTNSEE